MLKKFRLKDSKPTKTPTSMEIKLTKDDEADSVDSSKYREFALLVKIILSQRCIHLSQSLFKECLQKKKMMKKSSSSENESCSSKDCKKNNDSLNSKITDLTDKLFDAKNMIYHYTLALAQVKSRLVEYKEREVKYIEKIRILEYYDKGKKECIESLIKELESLKQEKEVVDGELAGLLIASKDLDNLIESQRPSPTVESTSRDDQNKNSSTSENGESTDSILSKLAVKFVKAANRSTSNKVEAVKKPSVRYVKLYRKPLKKSTVRGNQRNWNNLKSQQLGKVSHDYSEILGKRLGVKKGRTCPTYTHKSMPPRPSTHRPYRPPMRPNINSARPNKPGHSYGRRPFKETTQDLMIILIQRVQRLKRELKARTPKADRGRSRPVMAWIPKKRLLSATITLSNKEEDPIILVFNTQFRGSRVATVNRKFLTVNRKFPIVNKKFPTGNTKFSTADLGNEGTAVKASAC
nr:hypothetical protein [Tanacetum cinerariifolium]